MSRRIAVAFAWVAATLGSILIATAAVGSVRNNVSETPAPLRAAGVTEVVAAASSTTIAPLEGATTTSAAPPATPTTTAPSSTSTSTPTATPTSTTGTSPPAATTTTLPPSTTTTVPATTTTAPPDEEIATYALIGGTTTIRTDGEGVSLVAAVPASGFQVDVDKSGPEEVDVRYRSEDHTSRFKADWEDGELDIETSESEDD